MTRHWAAAALLLGACAPALADEACIDNFVTEGNLLTGRSFKTWAVLPGASRPSALSQAQAFTAENGFTILNVDRDAGTVSAAQSNTLATGRGAPLNLSFRDEAGGVRITLSYAMSASQFATEASIRRHFCMTVDAAARGDANRAATGAPTANAPRPQNAPIVPIAPLARRGLADAPTPRGHAAISTAQVQAIEQTFDQRGVPPKLRRSVEDAAPALTAYVARMSCVSTPAGGSALNEFAAPGHDIAYLFALSPMRNAQYHDKGTCMTVLRAQGFSAPAANALKFEVVYKADDSGETTKMPHEAVRQPDGRWLFNQ